MTVGRFAPSPTGRMHLGNIWSGLLSWLSVRAAGGEYVLRLEDLDPIRNLPEYGEQIKEDLRWLGLDWDREQPPQSTRTEAYAEVFRSFEEQGLVYPCYCSRADLHAASAPHLADGSVLYAGTCKSLTPEERAAKKKAPAWRLTAPEREFSFVDRLQGPVTENLAKECGDFIVRRADGVYAYQLAVVVDDAAGGITEIVRGRDLLGSTARQLYIYELIGAQPPSYTHIPMLLAPDGKRLSKREKSLDLGALRQDFTPEQLWGRLAALAGLIPAGETASAKELVPVFDWDKVPRNDIILDL